MNSADVAAYGDALLRASVSREAIAPLSETHADVSVQNAYAVQLHQVSEWKRSGRVVAGHKVGLTSRAMQTQLGVDEPDFGHLFSDMVIGGRDIDANRFINPRVEPEISFVLSGDLAGPGLTMADVIGAIDYAVASLEIIDSRIADWRIGLADTIADNASSAALVLGVVPLPIDSARLDLIGCNVTKNGELVATGAGGAVLGNPLEGVLWLANTLGGFGQVLEAGSIILAGALTAAIPVAPGDTVTARFAQLGSVTAHFTAAATPEQELQP